VTDERRAPEGGPEAVAVRDPRERAIDVEVEAVGVEGEIAVVRGPASIREPLARAAPAIRSLGFSYVALELDVEVITQRNA
jgi:hypothetical protein